MKGVLLRKTKMLGETDYLLPISTYNPTLVIAII